MTTAVAKRISPPPPPATEELRALAASWVPYAISLAMDHARKTRPGDHEYAEEACSVAREKLWWCALKMDPAKGQLSTYATHAIWRALWALAADWAKRLGRFHDEGRRSDDLDPADRGPRPDEAAEAADRRRWATAASDRVLRRLPERLRMVLWRRRGLGHSYAQIGSDLGVSRERARQLGQKATRLARQAAQLLRLGDEG